MENDKKVYRTLALYDELIRGHVVNKSEWAEEHGVNERSVRRYLQEIQYFLDEENGRNGRNYVIRNDRSAGGFRIAAKDDDFLTEGELFAICKILIESRAFKKEILESIVNRMLHGLISDQGNKRIHDYVAGELFSYLDPNHHMPDLKTLWKLAKAIREHRILEISYHKIGMKTPVKRRIRPVGIVFSEYYFYVMAILDSPQGEEYFQKSGPTSYRVDRIGRVTETDEQFKIPYSQRFKEGDFKNRVQFMYGGAVQNISFMYYGRSLEAVLDRLPTARAEEKEGGWLVHAEAMGDEGILMWLLSQGAKVEILSPATLLEKWRGEIGAMAKRAEEKRPGVPEAST